MWFASNKEVRRMVELTLLNIIYILFFSVNKKIKVDRTKADINNIGTY